VHFDEDGRISETPSWELVREVVRSRNGTKPAGAAGG